MISLLIKDITDKILRENFKRIETEFRLNQPFLRGEWKFFELNFDRAVTNFKFAHNLKFSPLDIVQTSIRGVGAITFNFSKFDASFLDITTTNACTVRFFVGSYQEGGT